MVGNELPQYVGLCPDPWHTHEFFVPLHAAEVAANKLRCPEGDCKWDLIVYTRLRSQATRRIQTSDPTFESHTDAEAREHNARIPR
jgi:hypothetical protein